MKKSTMFALLLLLLQYSLMIPSRRKEAKKGNPVETHIQGH